MDAKSTSVSTTPTAVAPPDTTGIGYDLVDLCPTDGDAWVNVQGGTAAIGGPGSVFIPSKGALRLPYGTWSMVAPSGPVLVCAWALTHAEANR